MQYLFLTGIILSIFLAFVLYLKRDKSIADYLLASWFCLSGMPLFSYYLVYTKQYLSYPSLTVFGMALPLASAPLLFLYTKYQTSPILFNPKDLFHFVPLIIVSLFFIDFYFHSFENRVSILKNNGEGYETQGLIKLIAIYFSGVIYIPWTLIKLIKYKKNLINEFSNTERINFNWLLYQIIGMAIVWIVIIFIQDDRFIFGSVSVFIIWLGYFGINQVNVFGQNIVRTSTNIESAIIIDTIPEFTENIAETNKYLKSALDKSVVSVIYKNLTAILVEKKPYTNPELTLRDLAKLLDVHPNHLSQVINSQTNKNFYDLINEKRIQEFLFRAALSENKRYTLTALAFDCGFNSKASFNRNFKKFTDRTPSEYLKGLKG